MVYRIKNWKKFQHFKDRRPPWIKLYREILDDREWFSLESDAAKALISLWLIASESDGDIPELKSLSFRLRIPERQTYRILGELYEAGFIVESEHEFEIEDGLTPAQQIAKNNGFGSRYISDEIKRQVLIRDKDICVSCSSKDRIEFDHIQPVSKGGQSTMENIQLLCRPCNRKKRARLAETGADYGYDQRSLETERETEKEKDMRSSFERSFEQFWQCYPKRRSRGDALKAWRALRPTSEQVSRIIAAINRAKTSEDWKKEGGQFIPYPATWLRSQGWEDEIAMPAQIPVADPVKVAAKKAEFERLADREYERLHAEKRVPV